MAFANRYVNDEITHPSTEKSFWWHDFVCVSLHSDGCVAETGNDAHAAKLLHSLLYTHLLKVDLLSAVEFIDSLVVQANVQSAIESHPLTQTPPIQPSFMTFITNTFKS